MSESKDSGYEVGHGKPPKEYQFKPGQSGNPKGRPKKSKNFATLIREELDRTITVREGSQARQISNREAIVKCIINGALKGNPRQLEFLFKYLSSQHEPEPFEITDDDEQELQKALASLKKSGGEDE